MDVTRGRPLQPGDTAGHYTILARLGRGGMGEVFVALDRKLDRKVAVKVLSADLVSDRERLRLFEREAKALAALNHPNIVTIFSVEDAGASHLLVMEFVEGRTLRDLIAPGGVALRQFFQIAVPLSEALMVAHEQGVTHRDLKPENVMLSKSGRVKVLDFGLAKISAGAVGTAAGTDSVVATLAASGAVLGTIPYMSPEQAAGKPVDQRSDIFSLGVVFYEMVTGERPFKGDTAAHVLASILRDFPSPVDELRPDVPPPLVRLIRLCLQKDPIARLQSTRDLHDELKDLALGPDEGRAKALRHRSDEARALTAGKRRSDRARSSRALRSIAAPATILQTRAGLTGVLALVFLANWLETTLETLVKTRLGIGTGAAQEIARALLWLEGGISFERHDLTNAMAIYGYAAAYFFVWPLMLLLTMIALARRDDIRPYRVFCLSIAATYAVSAAFFVFLPVPERWAFPDSEAILLSDLWSSRLIEAIRPISGLDNCFPSFHVASTVDAVLVGFLYRLRFRTAMPFVAAGVALSTFVLGIHWIADIAAGLLVGVASVWLAIGTDRRLSRSPESPTYAVEL